ncbi:hypothetical protein MTO96_005219 [Rhipicephalus appendiculatus]
MAPRPRRAPEARRASHHVTRILRVESAMKLEQKREEIGKKRRRGKNQLGKNRAEWKERRQRSNPLLFNLLSLLLPLPDDSLSRASPSIHPSLTPSSHPPSHIVPHSFLTVGLGTRGWSPAGHPALGVPRGMLRRRALFPGFVAACARRRR